MTDQSTPDLQSDARTADVLGDKAGPLAETWRVKQLEYTWLRSLMGQWENFWHVTGEALDYALALHDLEDPALRARLMQLYLQLDAYPEVPGVLEALKTGGWKSVILSNGTQPMVLQASKHAGIDELLDPPLSADSARIYKPAPAVYHLAVETYGVTPEEVCFMSANAWDIAGAATFGFRPVRINRRGVPAETLPGGAEAELPDLNGLPSLLGV